MRDPTKPTADAVRRLLAVAEPGAARAGATG
jgi:hypothetical protein